MTTLEIIELLRQKETPYREISRFSQLPGIYAIFFIGNNFPVFGGAVSRHQIIYIGKTESSQEKRDAKTHFTSGKTGSSTVRRSFGALLRERKNLTPIPRNNSDYKRGRLSHYKFDPVSEDSITQWMTQNLGLSFYEYPESRQNIEELETQIISHLVPILNLSKNPTNPFRSQIQELRGQCASMAYQGELTDKLQTSFKQNRNQDQAMRDISNENPKRHGKYIDLWTQYRPLIISALKSSNTAEQIQLNRSEFTAVGNRKKYSFNLELDRGLVANNIGGSAVARDLVSVLSSSKEAAAELAKGYVKIHLDNSFALWVMKR